jgi:hypothetical protein
MIPVGIVGRMEWSDAWLPRLVTGSRPVSTNLSAPAGIQSPAASVCPSDFSVDSLRDPAANRRTLQLVAPSNAHAACFSVRCRCFLPQTGAIAQTREPCMVIRRGCLRLVDGGSCFLQFLVQDCRLCYAPRSADRYGLKRCLLVLRFIDIATL